MLNNPDHVVFTDEQKYWPTVQIDRERGNDVSVFGDAYHHAHISGHHKAVEYITERFVVI